MNSFGDGSISEASTGPWVTNFWALGMTSNKGLALHGTTRWPRKRYPGSQVQVVSECFVVPG